jgi:hypothetical protein
MTSKKEWTDDEIRAEIKDAVRIVAEDREKARYLELHSRYGAKPEEGEKTEETEETEDDGGTKPPPQKPPKEEGTKKKRSLWWAESDDE